MQLRSGRTIVRKGEPIVRKGEPIKIEPQQILKPVVVVPTQPPATVPFDKDKALFDFTMLMKQTNEFDFNESVKKIHLMIHMNELSSINKLHSDAKILIIMQMWDYLLLPECNSHFKYSPRFTATVRAKCDDFEEQIKTLQIQPNPLLVADFNRKNNLLKKHLDSFNMTK